MAEVEGKEKSEERRKEVGKKGSQVYFLVPI